MKKSAKIILIPAVLLLCLCFAFVAYKGYGVYSHVREQLDIIEENSRHSADVIENNTMSVYSLVSKASADVGSYDFDYSWLEDNCLIAHALGGIDGESYTNSLEAMENAYAQGYRVFEGDLQLVEGRVVLVHDGDQYISAMGLDPANYDYEDFMQAKIKDSYTPMDAAAVVQFLSEHPDAWFMTDSKYTANPYAANVLSGFVIAALESEPSVLDRVIVQIYNQPMLETVMDIYPFRSVVYTLYQSADTNEQATAFCLRTGIGAVTAFTLRMTEDFSSQLNAAGIHPLVHTVNEQQEVQRFLDIGVSAVYSDFALPADYT